MHPSTPQSHLKGLMTCCLLMGRAQRTAHAAWDKKHQINYNNNKLWTFFKLTQWNFVNAPFHTSKHGKLQ